MMAKIMEHKIFRGIIFYPSFSTHNLSSFQLQNSNYKIINYKKHKRSLQRIRYY